jgi:uncharacterized protein DUF3352
MTADSPNGEPSTDVPVTIPTEPPSTVTTLPAGPGRGRLVAWIAAGGVVAAAVVVALTLLVGGRSAGLDAAAAYVPADSFFYLEAQLDLPDGQRATLRGILEKFPAVEADDLLGPALADTIDKALASGGAPVTYSDDIAPWFTGRVAVSVNAVPELATAGTFSVPPMVFLFGSRNAAAAGDAVARIRASLEGSSGVTFSSSERDGVKLWTAQTPADGMGTAPTTVELAVTPDQVILGLNGGGVTALDVHAGKADALSGDGDLAQLIERLPKARVAAMVVNTRALLQMGIYPSPLPSAIAAAFKATPDAGVASLSFEANAIRMDLVSGPLPDGAPTTALSGDLAAEVPSDTLVFVEAPAIGDAIGQYVETVKASAGVDPTTSVILEQLAQVESALGVKLEDYFDWAGGMALAAGRDGNDPWGGVLVEVNDAAGAAQRVGQLDAFIALASSDASSGISITHPTASGLTFTSVRVAGMAVPQGAAPPGGDLVFEYALANDRLLLGVGDGFIGRVLGLAAGDSLATADSYGRALAAVGGDAKHGLIFVDLDATRRWVESIMPREEKTAYDRDVGPNLAPLDYFAMGSRVDGRFVLSTMLLNLH